MEAGTPTVKLQTHLNAAQTAGKMPAPQARRPLAESRRSRITSHDSQATNHQSPRFDPAAYASFERATNDAVARDVRGSIGDTLARVMPEGVADGAARRIGEDIFNEVHRALAADRALSEQVAACCATGRIWRRGAAARRVAAGWAREAAGAQRGAARDWRMDEHGVEHGAIEGGAAGSCGFARRYCCARRIARFDAAAADVGARSELRVDERRGDFGNLSSTDFSLWGVR